MAILPGLQNDDTGLITILLRSALQTLIQFPDIAPLNHTNHPAKCQQECECELLYFLNNRSWYCTSFDRGHSDHLAESPYYSRADPGVPPEINPHENWYCQTLSGASTDLFPVENWSFCIFIIIL